MSDGNGSVHPKRIEQIAENIYIKFGFRVLVFLVTVIAIPFAAFVGKSYLSDIRSGQSVVIKKLDAINKDLTEGLLRDGKLDSRITEVEKLGNQTDSFQDRRLDGHDRRLDEQDRRLNRQGLNRSLTAPGIAR